MKDFKCGGVITHETTREELLARGWKPESIDEVFAFREKLRLKALRKLDDIVVLADTCPPPNANGDYVAVIPPSPRP